MRRWALSNPGVTAIFRDANARVPYAVRSEKQENPWPISRPSTRASAWRSRHVSWSSAAAHRSSDAR